MQTTLEKTLASELKQLRDTGQYKRANELQRPQAPRTQMDGRDIVMLSSNNYLGLADHPKVLEAARNAIEKYGMGTASVRFICGTMTCHLELEKKISEFIGCEAATTFISCWDANVGLMPTLAGTPEDAIFSDALNHASIIDAIRLSKAKRFIYKHRDLAELEQMLNSEDAKKARNKLIITDGVFSMEGDLAPLPEYVALKHEYGFPIVLDDAHGLGVLGEHGRGTAEHFGVEDEIDVVTGTFSKAFASIGGVIAGPAEVIDYVKHHGRSLIFSASMSPATVGAAHAALDLVQSEPWRREQVRANADYMCQELRGLGFEVGDPQSPVVPIYIGEDVRVFITWKHLFDAGVYCNPVIPPAVPPNGGMLRTSYMATHTRAQLDRALEIFEAVGKQLALI